MLTVAKERMEGGEEREGMVQKEDRAASVAMRNAA